MTNPDTRQAVPKEIRNSAGLWFVTLALHLIGIAVRAYTIPATAIAELRSQAIRAGGPVSEAVLQDTVRLTQLLMVLVFAALCVPWGVFIMRMRAGRLWARSLLSGLGWLSVILMVPEVISEDPSRILFYGATIVVEVAAIISMFSGPAMEYFARNAGARTRDRLR